MLPRPPKVLMTSMTLLVSWGEHELLFAIRDWVNPTFCSIGPIDLTIGIQLQRAASPRSRRTSLIMRPSRLNPSQYPLTSTTVPSIKHGELTLAFGCTNSTKSSGPSDMWYAVSKHDPLRNFMLILTRRPITKLSPAKKYCIIDQSRERHGRHHW